MWLAARPFRALEIQRLVYGCTATSIIFSREIVLAGRPHRACNPEWNSTHDSDFVFDLLLVFKPPLGFILVPGSGNSDSGSHCACNSYHFFPREFVCWSAVPRS
jgi:hypothetical protein